MIKLKIYGVCVLQRYEISFIRSNAKLQNHKQLTLVRTLKRVGLDILEQLNNVSIVHKWPSCGRRRMIYLTATVCADIQQTTVCRVTSWYDHQIESLCTHINTP